MFDVGFSEIFLIAIVAIIAIGPEDLPDTLFRVGRFVRQVKMFLGNIQNQYGEIMHEAEMAHYRKKLNENVLADDPAPDIEKEAAKEITREVLKETVHEKPAHPDHG